MKKTDAGPEKNLAKGCGCLASILGLPLFLFIILIVVLMWIMVSLMSCGSDVVLEDILGLDLTEEEKQMLLDALAGEKSTYDQIGEYFRDNGCADQAAVAQGFFILYRDRVLSRDNFLADLLYCFGDGVKLRTITRLEERFQLVLTEDELDQVIAYARSNYLDTSTFMPEKNGGDLARIAQMAADGWCYYPRSYGQVMSLDKPYVTDYDDPLVWQLLGFRTVDNIGLFRAYAWLDKETGDILASDTNLIATNYETGKDLFDKAPESFPVAELAFIGEAGMGVYDEESGAIGIYLGGAR